VAWAWETVDLFQGLKRRRRDGSLEVERPCRLRRIAEVVPDPRRASTLGRDALLAVAIAVLLVGGGDDEATTTDTGTTAPPTETTALSVYWLLDGKVGPTLREVEETEAVATAALEELLIGPTQQEEDELLRDGDPEGVELES
jgi:hypothetical protein